MKLNKRQAAEMFGKSVNTIGKWIAAGMPVEEAFIDNPRKKGLLLDSAAIIAWRIGQETEKKTKIEKAAAARLQEIKVEMAELDLAERRGELIAADDALKTFGELLHEARQRLVALPGELAPLMAAKTDPVDIQQELVRSIDGCLESLNATYGVSSKG